MQSSGRGWWTGDGMMDGVWSMGPGMFGMLALLLFLVAASAVLVLLLRRSVAGDTEKRIRGGALRRLSRQAAAFGRPATPAGEEFDGFLVIPDISGYTEFMRMSAFALAHAQYAISELLSSLIEAADNRLAIAKIEGDAVFLYGARADGRVRGGLTGAQIGDVVGDMLRAFYRRRAELIRVNACACKSCRHVGRLELKVVVHSGRLLLYDLRGQPELSGLPVIVAHRLLKSDLGLARYVLVTEAAAAEVTLPLNAEPRRHSQSYPGVGRIDSLVYEFDLDSLFAEETAARPGAKAADAARKLVEGLRALRAADGRA